MSNYSISRSMAASEVFITPSTSDATGDSIVIVTTTSNSKTILPQYSLDSGSTWNDHAGGSYTVAGTTDTRTITIPSGILRITCTDSTGAGTVEFTITTSTTSETGVVTSTDVYRASGLTSTKVSVADVKSHILRAYSEARMITGRPAGSEQRSESHWGNNKKSLFMHYSPIVTLDSLTISDTSVTTSYVDVVEETGQLILKSTAEVTRFTLPANETPTTSARNVSATYTWGYFNVPYWYNRLVEILAALSTLTQQMGGTSDDVTSYTVGDVSASKGEPYTNIRATMFELQREKSEIIGRYVRKAPAVF